jgi:hypothetical protein
MHNLYHPRISQSEVDDLYNGTLIPRKFRPVALSGTGTIKRGTPLTSDDGETYTVWEKGKDIIGILVLDIDTSETEEAENAPLGYSGEFNRRKIEEVLESELDPLAVMQTARDNIHIEYSYAYPHAPVPEL